MDISSPLAPPPRARTWLWWAPLLALALIAGLAAAGLGLSGSASALSTATINAEGTISNELHITSLCGDETSSFVLGPTALTTDSSVPEEIGSGCEVVFGGNSANGTSLRITNSNASGPFFCRGTGAGRNCGTASYSDIGYSGGVTQLQVPSGSAGYRYDGAALPASSDLTAGSYYGVPTGSSAELCSSASNDQDGACTITFAARTSATQMSGAYEGIARIQVFAL